MPILRKFKYPSQAEIVSLISDMFNETRLDMLFDWWTEDSNRVYIQTTLIHASGETMQLSKKWIGADLRNAKEVGAAIGYLKRYEWLTILGIPTADEAESMANGKGYKKITESQLQALKNLIGELNFSEPDKALENLCRYFKIVDIVDLNALAYDDAVSVLVANAPKNPVQTPSDKESGILVLSDEQMGTLREHAKQKGFSNIARTMDRLASHFGVKSLREIPAERFADAMAKLDEGPK